MLDRAILLITGIQAAGKSTIAQGIAERLPRSVHLRGDAFRRMVVGGREEMSATPSEEALRQLRLRHRLTAQAADAYFAAGFAVIAQDVVLGEHLSELVEQVHSRPLLVVVLAPDVEAIAEREASRGKTAYDTWAIAELNEVLHERTPRLGLWLDTSDQTPEQTIEEVLRRWPEAVV
ncbi:AAA family ATPase [Saccharopolyspora sp. NPDC000359]|uniref:AAA family ATPase n=1 Tax=Saccharopolyspora sp. NPDC000359 TaxID=3154251 RepID=UPI00333250AC